MTSMTRFSGPFRPFLTNRADLYAIPHQTAEPPSVQSHLKILKVVPLTPISLFGEKLQDKKRRSTMRRSVITIFAFLALTATLSADIRIGMADAVKAATSKVQPQYPAVARQMKISGHVEIEAVIGPDGSVDSAKAVSGNPMLTQPAIAAVEKWKFSPFTSNGEATKAVVTLGFDFRP